MIERLHYDMDDMGNMTLDVPRATFAATIDSSRLGEILEQPERLVVEEQQPGGHRLLFDRQAVEFARSQKGDDRDACEVYASHWYATLHAIQQHVGDNQHDPRMKYEISEGPIHDLSGQGRRGMRAELAWPLSDDRQASRLATHAMRQTGMSLGYLRRGIEDSAFADASRETGVALEALNIGACSLDTDGHSYNPNASRISLKGHNVYSRQIALTCLSGLIVLARSHDTR